ncbi:MAG: hypothetical protein OER96_08475 [Gammaproteobacteria bacterium]|nr:hypothetical protein [Gammaproteobacteria bacterium]
MNKKGQHWLVQPKNISRLRVVFAVVLVLCVAAGFLVHQHVYFGVDGIFGFYAWFGLITCLLMIVVAKVIGIMIKRPDNYYDQQS